MQFGSVFPGAFPRGVTERFKIGNTGAVDVVVSLSLLHEQHTLANGSAASAAAAAATDDVGERGAEESRTSRQHRVSQDAVVPTTGRAHASLAIKATAAVGGSSKTSASTPAGPTSSAGGGKAAPQHPPQQGIAGKPAAAMTAATTATAASSKSGATAKSPASTAVIVAVPAESTEAVTAASSTAAFTMHCSTAQAHSTTAPDGRLLLRLGPHQSEFVEVTFTPRKSSGMHTASFLAEVAPVNDSTTAAAVSATVPEQIGEGTTSAAASPAAVIAVAALGTSAAQQGALNSSRIEFTLLGDATQPFVDISFPSASAATAAAGASTLTGSSAGTAAASTHILPAADGSTTTAAQIIASSPAHAADVGTHDALLLHFGTVSVDTDSSSGVAQRDIALTNGGVLPAIIHVSLPPHPLFFIDESTMRARGDLATLPPVRTSTGGWALKKTLLPGRSIVVPIGCCGGATAGGSAIASAGGASSTAGGSQSTTSAAGGAGVDTVSGRPLASCDITIEVASNPAATRTVKAVAVLNDDEVRLQGLRPPPGSPATPGGAAGVAGEHVVAGVLDFPDIYLEAVDAAAAAAATAVAGSGTPDNVPTSRTMFYVVNRGLRPLRFELPGTVTGTKPQPVVPVVTAAPTASSSDKQAAAGNQRAGGKPSSSTKGSAIGSASNTAAAAVAAAAATGSVSTTADGSTTGDDVATATPTFTVTFEPSVGHVPAGGRQSIVAHFRASAGGTVSIPPTLPPVLLKYAFITYKHDEAEAATRARAGAATAASSTTTTPHTTIPPATGTATNKATAGGGKGAPAPSDAASAVGKGGKKGAAPSGTKASGTSADAVTLDGDAAALTHRRRSGVRWPAPAVPEPQHMWNNYSTAHSSSSGAISSSSEPAYAVLLLRLQPNTAAPYSADENGASSVRVASPDEESGAAYECIPFSLRGAADRVSYVLSGPSTLVSAKVLSFRPTMLLQSRTSSFQVSNTSAVALHYDWSCTRPDVFSVTPSVGTISGGETGTFSARFAPTLNTATDAMLASSAAMSITGQAAPLLCVSLSGFATRPVGHIEMPATEAAASALIDAGLAHWRGRHATSSAIASTASPSVPSLSSSSSSSEEASSRTSTTLPSVLLIQSVGLGVPANASIKIVNTSAAVLEYEWARDDDAAAEGVAEGGGSSSGGSATTRGSTTSTAGAAASRRGPPQQHRLPASTLGPVVERGWIPVGATAIVDFEFVAADFGITEHTVKLVFPAHGVSCPLLVLGLARRPRVSLDRAVLRFSPHPFGAKSTGCVVLVNDETTEVSFAWHEAGAAAHGGDHPQVAGKNKQRGQASVKGTAGQRSSSSITTTTTSPSISKSGSSFNKSQPLLPGTSAGTPSSEAKNTSSPPRRGLSFQPASGTIPAGGRLSVDVTAAMPTSHGPYSFNAYCTVQGLETPLRLNVKGTAVELA